MPPKSRPPLPGDLCPAPDLIRGLDAIKTVCIRKPPLPQVQRNPRQILISG